MWHWLWGWFTATFVGLVIDADVEMALSTDDDVEIS